MTKVLFTGLTGFLGENFVDCIKDENLNLMALSCDVLAAEGKISDFTYRFSKEDLIEDGIKEIDILVHAGAFSPKTLAQLNDIDNNILNVTNTAHLINNLPSIPKKIVYISSISVYKMSSCNVILETSPAEGDSIYGLSKLMSEKIITKFAEENNIECQILRLGVMYGKNKSICQGLVPTFIDNIISNKSICVFNDGDTLRNFVHVEDVCQVIYQAIIQPQIKHPIINVVNKYPISVIDVAKKLIAISGKDIRIESIKKDNINPMVFDTVYLDESFNIVQKSYDDGLAQVYNFYIQE